MKIPWLSIIVPVYNQVEEQFRQCVESLLSQSFADFELILVDDGCTGDCGVICDEYAQRDSRIRVIHQQNEGTAAARNVGIDGAWGEWITFVNADDWVETDMVKTMNDNAQKVDSDVLVFSAYVDFAGKEQLNPFFADQFRVLAGESKDDAILQCIYRDAGGFSPRYESISVSYAKVYKTAFLKEKELKFISEGTKGHDTLFQINAFEHAESILYVNQPVYHHRIPHMEGEVVYQNRIFRSYDTMLREIATYIDTYRKPQSFLDAYYARVNGCLLSAINSDYYHPENRKNARARRAGLKRLIAKKAYKEALHHVNPQFFSLSTRLGLFLLRFRLLRLYSLGRKFHGTAKEEEIVVLEQQQQIEA